LGDGRENCNFHITLGVSDKNRTSDNLYKFDDVTVDCENFHVQKQGKDITLTPRAFDVLILLLQSRGQVIEKQEFFERIWKGTFVTDNALTKIIKEIRHTLDDNVSAPRYIETVPKRGYRFIAEVTENGGANHIEPLTASTKHLQSDDNEAGAQDSFPKADAAREFEPKANRFFARKLSVALAILALTAAGIWFFYSQYQSPVVGVRKVEQITTWSGLDFYPSISPDGNTIAFSSDRTGSFEIYVKQIIAGAKEVQITSDGAGNFHPAFSPDGNLLAYYSRKRGGIWIVPVTGGAPKQLTEFGGSPAWSPDGKTIAFANGNHLLDPTGRNANSPETLWLVAVESGEEPRRLTQPNSPAGGHSSPNWSPDGRRIVFDTNDPSFSEVWSVSANGDDLKKLSGDLAFATDAVYAPEGKSVFFVANIGSSLYQVNLSPVGDAIGEPVKIYDVSNSRIRSLSVAAKANRIAYSAMTLSSNLWSISVNPGGDTVQGESIDLTQSANTRNTQPAFSPDGKQIAYAAYDAANHLQIWTMNADGRNKTQITSGEQCFSPSWFPDGKRIAFRSERGNQINVSSVTIEGAKVKNLFELDHSTNVVRLSPDGRQFAFSSTRNGGVANIWLSSTDGSEQKQLTFDKIRAGFPTWSPDGKWIIFEKEDGSADQMAVVPIGDGEPVQLTLSNDKSWSWSSSPDGDKILFAGERDDIWNVYWLSLATKQQKQLTNFTKPNSYVRYPAWSPLRNQIVYEYAETTGNIWIADFK
jgi:Tol biopolymer transport system component/DNA-binding winged helix-turn-helix (wHTH) protein